MSQPKRYSIRGFSAALVEEDNGVLVKWEDYAALQAEVEKYRRVFQGEAGWILVEPNHYAALQAEVERLRKAGDAMENELFRVILMELPGLEKEDINNQYIADWRAAKGVQP